ncbi:MAG: hypothetical protein LPK09_07095 [Hymenobacteraceae bacterium]|nr:hypothetical protein [Hymenobacteraceae bacterium]
MQEVSIRLFSRSYNVRSKVERALLLLALLSVGLHGWLLFQLIAVRDLHSAMTFLYLFSLLPFCLFLASVWLDRNPGYQRHLTLLSSGVRYRLGFMQQEQEFDWEEVELIEMNNYLVEFELKNGERHVVSLESVDKDLTLQEVRLRLEGIAADKEIQYRLIK